jgi:hypothetical protein
MTKFDLEKCVVHSLGRVLLLYANNSSRMADLIDDGTLTMKILVIEDMLRTVSLKYSIALANFIASLLQENSLKRLDFDNIQEYFQSEEYSELQWMLAMRKKRSEVQSSTETHSLNSSIQMG